MTLAASPGFELGDAYVVGLAFIGIAVFAAIGALSHQHDRAFSASVIYLGLGLLAAVALEVTDIGWVDPVDNAKLFEKVAELAVIVALFGTGLKLDRDLKWHEWRGVARLLAVAMPLTIGAVVLYGTSALGLSLAAAIALGAALSPTDPVLAGDIGVGPPGDEEEHEPNFSITGEAGLNDGLAFPFVFLAAFIAESRDLGEWLLTDVVYAIVAGVAIGGAIGYLLAALIAPLRDRNLLARELDGWIAIAAVLLIYGLTEMAGAYGFLAAFAGGVAFRRYETGHEQHASVHAGAEMVEKFGELAAVLLLASSVTITGLQAPGIEGWVLVVLLLVLIRPVSVLVSLLGTRLPQKERFFIAWFGVRGIGSLYYVAVIAGLGILDEPETQAVVWTVTACILVSIVVHGISSAPLSRRWLPPEQQPEHA